MTTAPYIELRVNPTDLRPGDLPKAGEFLGTPADAIEAALAVTRAAMVDQMKKEIRGLGAPTHYQLLKIADMAWQAGFWRYRKISAPMIADAYLHAYKMANAGDVPMSVIYDLADKHAEKVGTYFHETSREALAEGFNSMVNRQIPARVAADRVLDAYGLTPRQMRGYASAKQFGTPVSDVLPRSLKSRARAYIDKAFTQRTRKLSRQEEHNIDEQAKQFAWMWLQDKGRLNKKAQKLWITAKDERVCPVCGPLHGKKVGINERFMTKEGGFWSPGLHPNCRCVVRLLEHTFSKADEWNPKLHPRGYHGRFGTKTRTKTAVGTLDVDEEFRRITAPITSVDRTTDTDPQQDLKFQEITQYGILKPASTYVPKPRPKVSMYVPAPVQVEAPVAAPAPQTTAVSAPAPVIAPVEAPGKLKPLTQAEAEAKKKAKVDPNDYFVLPEGSFDPTNARLVDLNPGDEAESYTSPEQAAAVASSKLEDRIDELTESVYARGTTVVDSDGKEYRLKRSELRDVLSYLAGVAQKHPLQTDRGPKKALYVGGSDYVGPKLFGARTIGNQIGVSENDFTPLRIVSVNRKHAQKLPPDEASSSTVDHEFNGRFRQVGGVKHVDQFGIPIVHVAPHKAKPLKKRD
jgi:hypothetical protein